MKDLVQIWNRVSDRRYSAVNVTEVNDLPNKKCDGKLENFDCELNFEEIDFNEKKHAIINKLFERRRKGQITRQPKCKYFSITSYIFIVTFYYLNMKIKMTGIEKKHR